MEQRGNFMQRAVSRVTTQMGTVVEKATASIAGLAPAMQSSQNSLLGFLGFGGGVHEPFTQAWQRNMEDKNPRDRVMLAFSAVYSCVAIISQDIAKMTLRAMHIDEKDGVTQRVANGSPYQRVLANPNDYQSSLQFVQYMVSCILMRGNAYILQVLDNRGVPRSLHVLNPDRTKVFVHPESKEVFYEHIPLDSDMAPMSEAFGRRDSVYIIPARYIIHPRINCLWHPMVGVSPLFAGASSAATGGRIVMNSERFFANMSRPSGFLSSDSNVQDNTATRLKREFEANYSLANIGRTAVLGDGLKWHPMVMSSNDAQLIEQLKWTIEDVARVYRVPMYLLNDTTRMTYKNGEQASQAYFQGCLQFYVTNIEEEFAKAWDFNRSLDVIDFDVSVLFRMDMAERFEAYNKGITSGVLSPNEARAMEGKGPVEGGEEPRMQMQYVPLSQKPEPAAAVGVPAPTDEEPPQPAEDDEDDEPTDDTDDTVSESDKAAAAAKAATEFAEFIARMAAARNRVKKTTEGISQ